MIDSQAYERLRPIGLTPAVMQQLGTLGPALAEPVLMRVVEVQREGLTLHDGSTQHPARLLPAFPGRTGCRRGHPVPQHRDHRRAQPAHG